MIKIWNKLRLWVKLSFLTFGLTSIGYSTYSCLNTQEIVENKPINFTYTDSCNIDDKGVNSCEEFNILSSITPVNDKKTFASDSLTFLLNFEHIEDAKIQSFLNRFLKIAIVEKYKYNIPIAIKLSQGIIESNCGRSNLAKKSNNFFGMKCTKKCKKCSGKNWEVIGSCINISDDGPDDLFRMFKTPWLSWRSHSMLLTKNRYKHLLKFESTDYKNWARGLKSAGYATHKKYAEILINVIEKNDLAKYDKIDIYELASGLNIDLSKIKKHNS